MDFLRIGWKIIANLYDNAGASADLSWFALLVDFAQSRPFTQLFAGIDFDKWNLMFIAQGSDQFFVLWLVTWVSQDTKDRLTSGIRKRKGVLDYSILHFHLQDPAGSMFSGDQIISSKPFTYLSKALQAWWIPWTNPSATNDFFKTSWSATFTSIAPSRTAVGASLKWKIKTLDYFIFFQWEITWNPEKLLLQQVEKNLHFCIRHFSGFLELFSTRN